MKNTLALAYIKLTISSIFFGVLVFGGQIMRNQGFSLIEIIVLPSSIVAICLAWFSRKDIKKFCSVPLWMIILYLISATFGQLGQFAPLFLGLSVSLTVFLLYTQPLWTTLISTIFLKTPFTSKEGTLMGIMIVGLIFLLSPWEDFQFSILGFILAIMGGICMSVWIMLNSYFVKKELKPVSLTFIASIYTAVPLIVFYPIFAHLFPTGEMSGINLDKSFNMWGAVIAYSIIGIVLAQMLFYNAAKKINNVHLGLVLLLEPVVAAILDVSFLGTTLTWNILFGGFLILAANAYLILKSATK